MSRSGANADREQRGSSELTWGGASGWCTRPATATTRRCTSPTTRWPRTDSRQNVTVSRVETTPATRLYRYTDYWGTAVTAFDLHAPHKELAVVATSVVETADPQQPVRRRELGGAGRRRRPRPSDGDARVHHLRGT